MLHADGMAQTSSRDPQHQQACHASLYSCSGFDLSHDLQIKALDPVCSVEPVSMGWAISCEVSEISHVGTMLIPLSSYGWLQAVLSHIATDGIELQDGELVRGRSVAVGFIQTFSCSSEQLGLALLICFYATKLFWFYAGYASRGGCQGPMRAGRACEACCQEDSSCQGGGVQVRPCLSRVGLGW
jgi:hypothetical protein